MLKYVLNTTNVFNNSMYVGEFIIESFNDKFITLRFKDKNAVKVENEIFEKLKKDGPIECTAEDIYEFTNSGFTKAQIRTLVKNVTGYSGDKLNGIITKIRQDAYDTAGYQRCLNMKESEEILKLKLEGKTKSEIEKMINQKTKKGDSKIEGKCINCGPIFNRRSRNCSNVYSSVEEEKFLRNEDNFGMLPQGVKAHESATLRSSNGIVFKLLSWLIRLDKFDKIDENIYSKEKINEEFLKILENYKTKGDIYDKDYNYIVSYHNSSDTVKDFLTNKIMSLDDIENQSYKSKEHGINFCHIDPTAGTNVKNCCYASTRYNRDQGDVTKLGLLIMNIYSCDGDPRRNELVRIIRCNDDNINNIFKSDSSKSEKIANIEKYLNSQYY